MRTIEEIEADDASGKLTAIVGEVGAISNRVHQRCQGFLRLDRVFHTAVTSADKLHPGGKQLMLRTPIILAVALMCSSYDLI
jgi:hypothetical protein